MNRTGPPTTPSATDKAETCQTHGSVKLQTAAPLQMRDERAAYPLLVKPPASAHPLELFLSGLHDGVLLTNQGYIVSANPSAETLLEYTLAELDGRHIGEIIEQLDDDTLELLEQKAQDYQYALLEAYCRLRSGISIPVEIAVSSGRPLPEATLCFMIRNVEERREVEEHLQAADLALNSVAHGIVMTDAEGVLQHVNPAFLSMLDYSEESAVLGRNIRYFLQKPDEINGVLRRLHERLICSRQVTGRKKDEQPLPLQITASPSFDQEGNLRHMIFLLEDTTARTENERLREQSAAQQHKVEVQQAGLNAVADMAYALNNPLQNLLGMAEEDQNLRYKEQIDRIVDIVRQLYEQHEQQFRQVNPEPAAPTGAPVEPHLQPCKPHTVLVVDDEDMIRRLFERLLKNSFDDLQVTQAASGRQALDLFTEHHYAVIILDVIMPAMRGEAVFAEIARICEERQWELPHCIFCTGFMPSTQVTKIVRDSRHALLRKPVSRNEIVSIMEPFL